MLEYKQRKDVLEEEVARLNAEIAKLRPDTTEQVWHAVVSLISNQQHV